MGSNLRPFYLFCPAKARWWKRKHFATEKFDPSWELAKNDLRSKKCFFHQCWSIFGAAKEVHFKKGRQYSWGDRLDRKKCLIFWWNECNHCQRTRFSKTGLAKTESLSSRLTIKRNLTIKLSKADGSELKKNWFSLNESRKG